MLGTTKTSGLELQPVSSSTNARRGNRMTDHRESNRADYEQMLKIAIEEARQGLAEGGIPIGAALFDRHGKLLGRGHNRRMQENDPPIHGEPPAFPPAARPPTYHATI